MADIKLNDFQPGQRYSVQVRTKHTSQPDKISEWSSVYQFVTTNDTVPPGPPTNVTLVSEGSAFVAKWKAPTINANGTVCTDLDGYWLVFKNTLNLEQVTRETFVTGTDFTLDFETNKEMFGTARGQLTLEIKAADQIGNRSTAATATAVNPPPADVTGLTATPGIETIVVNWDKNTTDIDLTGYEVHVSTASASFVPSAATRRFFGNGTSFVIPTGNPTPHYIKVRAIDIFNTPSANDATATATPKTTTSTDGTPPGGVTNITLNSQNDGVVSALRVGWTPPADADIDHYTVRYALNTTDWSYIDVPADQVATVIGNLKPGTPYYVGVQTWDFAANKSAWVNAATYPATTLKDTVAPNKPAVPTVSTNTTRVQIAHNMKDSAGANLATDTDHLEIHAGTSNTFTPDASTKVQEIASVGVGVSVNTVISYVTSGNTFWRVIAVDTSGNKSTASDSVQGNPGLITGANIENATITDANIQTLSAAKLVAGSAFVNDLFIRSGLTIDNANGKIQSDDYNVASQLGWKLDRDGLYLYEGTVAAKSLLIQDSQNMVPPQFADFEFADRYYFNTDNTVNTANLAVLTSNTRLYKDSSARFGAQSLRVVDTVGGGSGAYAFFTPSSSQPNIDVEPGETYIISFYLKNNLSTATPLTIAPRNINIGAYNITAQPGTTFVRYQYPFVVPAGITRISMVAGTSVANTPFDFSLDGLQVERKIGKLDTASPWTPPGATTINGESITTGSIRSSAPAEGIANQPAWSLNTTGGLQVGDALVRGNLTVGAGVDTTTSKVKSSDYQEGVSGWIIRGDGYAEFNSGVFRSDLLLERISNALTLRLKASVADNIVYTPGGTLGQVTVGQPLITGQSYGFNRSTNASSGGFYVPTTPNAAKKMRFSIGPTTARNVVIQTTDADVEGVYSTNPPDNVQLNSMSVGEQINYTEAPNIREKTGFKHLLYQRENPTASFVNNAGTVENTNNIYYNTNYVGSENSINIRSPFVPETNNKQSTLTDFYSSATNLMQAQATYYAPRKNLMREPYDYSTGSANNFGSSPSYNDQVGPGSGGVTPFGTIGITGWNLPMLFDDNYKVPVYLVNFTPSIQGGFFFMNTGQTVATAVHTGFRRGKTYIFSVFIRTNLSDGGGTQASPSKPFNLTFGLRMQTSGTSYIDYAAATPVQPGMAAQRVSVAITLPAGTPEFNRAVPYMIWGVSDSATTTTRQVAITRPQIEEKTWGNNPNPEIAASNAPTAWGTALYNSRSENYSALKLVTNANSDWVYDAYGRYDPDMGTSYAAQATGTYREAPNYLDIILNRQSYRPGAPYANETNQTVYRFSEAGVMYPGADEPMRPAGLEAIYTNRTITAKQKRFQISANGAISGSPIQRGSNDIRINAAGDGGFKVMRSGFYFIHCGVHVPSAGSDGGDLLWMTFEVNGAIFHNQGIGRNFAAGLNTSTVRYFNRGDVITAQLNSGDGNGLNNTVEGPRMAMVRIS